MNPVDRPSLPFVPEQLLAELESTGLLERIDDLAGTRYVIPAWVRRVLVQQPTDAVRATVVLSRREQSVLEALALTGSRQAIADSQYVSLNTVKTQLASVYRKLGATTRLEALVLARRHGLLPSDPELPGPPPPGATSERTPPITSVRCCPRWDGARATRSPAGYSSSTRSRLDLSRTRVEASC